MEDEIKKRLAEQDNLLKKTYVSVEKTRKYFLWTLVVSLITFILPLVGLIFILPKVLSTYTQALSGF